MNWFDSLLVFEKIVEHQSFSHAARKLQLPTSVATKRIQWLEKQLDTTLFVRTTRLVTITEAGDHLLKCVKPLLDEWQDVQKQLLDYQADPQGTLAICTPPNISNVPFFIEFFKKFIMLYPKIKLCITTTASPISLIQGKIDILLATEKYVLNPQDCVGIKFLPFAYHCYGAPSYLTTHGIPKKPSDLAKHNCLIFRSDYHWEFSESTTLVSGNWQTDSGDSLISACRAGIGLAYVPNFMVQSELREGQIQAILESYHSKEDWLSLFYVKHQYKPRKIALFIDFIRQYFDI